MSRHRVASVLIKACGRVGTIWFWLISRILRPGLVIDLAMLLAIGIAT